MAETSKIGIVTVTYNSGGVIDGFLRSVFQQSHADFMVYVIDNASSDLTLQRVETYEDPRLVMIRNEKNLGVAKGNNQGISAALADGCAAVLIVNNDTEFEPRLLELLYAALDQYSCDVTVPKMLYFDPPDRIWCAGGQFQRWKGYLPRHYGGNEVDRGQYDTAREVEYTPTCCMLVRSRVFQRVGMMDEQYFVYFDDTDFCFRAMLAGMKMVYVPQVKLWHKVSSLTGEGSSFSTSYLTRNHVYFMRKNLGFWRRLALLTGYQVRLGLKLLSGVTDYAGFALRQRAFWAGLHMPILKDGPAMPPRATEQRVTVQGCGQ